MPEAKLAKEAEIPYALVALVTDYDCWKVKGAPAPGSAPTAPPDAAAERPDPAALLKEIIANLQTASTNAMELIRRALRRIAADPAALDGCPARDALKLAIWSDKTWINPEEIHRLGPLWGRYFG
jgi:5'-methylthioadenosine phosphorylase